MEALLECHPKAEKLLEVKGIKAFLYVLKLSLIPTVPSGAVDLFTAYRQISLSVFTFASMLGNVPSLLIKAYLVKSILEFHLIGKLILTGILLYLLIQFINKMGKKKWTLKEAEKIGEKIAHFP
jgi:uncharacterized membrane protein YdjX (TVP38/TMEM64 family)